MLRSEEYKRGYDDGYKAALERVAGLREAERSLERRLEENWRKRPPILRGTPGYPLKD